MDEFPDVVDEPIDMFGAEDAATHLALLLERVQPGPGRPDGHGLWPPLAAQRDRIHGPAWAPSTLIVFGAFGAPSSRPLGQLLAHVRDDHVGTTRIAWRHFPDPNAHPRAAMLALAAEAAATRGRFWTATRELLKLRHQDPGDVRSARTWTPTFAPTLFIGDERYAGELRPAALSAALENAAGS
jgi:hypothetical protein